MIHDRTGRAIETLYAQQIEDHYSSLAHHYLRGSDAAKAIHYVQLAAEQAEGRGAHSEATSMLNAALRLVGKLPQRVERLKAELELRRIEGVVSFAVNGGASPERERVIRRMCEIGEEIGQGDRLLPGLIALGGVHFGRGECIRSLELSRRCIQLGATTQEPRLLVDAHFLRGCSAYSCGNLLEAVSNYQAGIGLVDQTNFSISHAGYMYTMVFPCHLALALQLLGRVGEAAKLAEQALRQARESKYPSGLGFALITVGRLDHYRREPERVLAYTEEALAVSEEYGLVNWLEIGRFFHGWAVAELRQMEQGVAEMEAGITGFRRLGGVPWQQYANVLLAHGYTKMGRPEGALGMMDEALAHIERTGEKIDQAEMLRLKGEMLLMRGGGTAAEAESCFRAAIEVSRAQEARWWELRATTSLAKLLRDSGRRDEARAMLAEIYHWFTDGFDTADMKDAKALLEELRA